MKIRPAASMLLLDESMEQVVEVSDRTALLAYLRNRYDFWNPTDKNVTIRYYGYDSRIGWTTYLICVDGHAALFADGSFTRYEWLRGPPPIPSSGQS